MVSDIQPPSAFLPQLKGIRTCSRKDLADAITRLRDIYIHPQVRGSTRRRLQRPSESSVIPLANRSLAGLKSDLNLDQLTVINADPFERSFAIQWLTRFISISSELTFESEDDILWGVDVLEDAASLLAVCAGVAASGNIERAFVFPFTHTNFSHPQKTTQSAGQGSIMAEPIDEDLHGQDINEIHVTLRDAPLESSDFSSVGAQTWGGSCILAEMIAELPQEFGISEDMVLPERIRSPFRALELGAGTGLASIVLGKVLERKRPFMLRPTLAEERCAPRGWPECGPELDVVVATDFHPSVLVNLGRNIENNFPSNTHSPTPPVIALPLDWSLVHGVTHSDNYLSLSGKTNHDRVPDADSTIASSFLSPLDAPFDLIIGADIIYEPLHARWVRSCVERFLRKPDPLSRRIASPLPSGVTPYISTLTKGSALFHLIIPLRRTHSVETRTVEEVFTTASEILGQRGASGSSSDGSTNPSIPSICIETMDVLLSPAPELAILSQQDIICDAYSDAEETEEVVYRYYRIGWV